MFKTSLKDFSSDLSSEWDYDKNAPFTPDEVAKSSSKKVWWQCKHGHHWQAVIRSRVYQGHGCPFCAGKHPTKSNNLAIMFPEIAIQWHTALNGDLNPRNILSKSGRKVWWQCVKGHAYEAKISNRTANQSGCPYCAGQKVTEDNCFALCQPEMVREWHPRKNGKLFPENHTQFSGTRVWWKCKKGHEWIASISDRSRGTGCPFCWKHTSAPEFRLLSELEFIFGKIIRRRKFRKLEVDLFIEKYQIGIEYDGSYWHRGKEIRDRKKQERLSEIGIKLFRVREEPLEVLTDRDVLADSRGLKKGVVDMLVGLIRPSCDANDQISIEQYITLPKFQNERMFRTYLTDLPEPDPQNSLASQNTELVKEFDYKKNHPLRPENYSRGSQELVWWKCKKGHSWETGVLTRTINKSGCPYCSRNFASEEHNLLKLYPEVAVQLHATKNGSLQPKELLPSSSRKVWWQCQKGHEWKAVVANRTINKSGCPYCAGSIPSEENNLLDMFPSVSKNWHPSKNADLRPEQLTPSSGKEVWWHCQEGHEWKSAPSKMKLNLCRNGNVACPKCKKIANSLAFKFPEIAKEWDPLKNEPVTSGDVSYGSKIKYWWKCIKGHSWEASSNTRTRPTSSGCPYCAGSILIDDNTLLRTNPELSKEWDNDLNLPLTPKNVRKGTKEKVWWRCSEGHSWEAFINVRATRGTGCPVCAREVLAQNRRKNKKIPNQSKRV